MSVFKAASLTLNLARRQGTGFLYAAPTEGASRHALPITSQPFSACDWTSVQPTEPQGRPTEKGTPRGFQGNRHSGRGREHLPARAAALSRGEPAFARARMPNFPRCRAPPEGGDCINFRERTRPRRNYVSQQSGRELQTFHACFADYGGREETFGVPCPAALGS